MSKGSEVTESRVCILEAKMSVANSCPCVSQLDKGAKLPCRRENRE